MKWFSWFSCLGAGALALGAAACVDQAVPDKPAKAAAPAEEAPSDLSGAPQRGGPSGMSSVAAQEAALDDSPSLADVLRVQSPEAVADGVALTSRMRRLTTPEYQHTVADLLSIESAEDFGPDETIRAVIGGSGG